MKFLRLPDPLLSILYEDDGIIGVDKPYGIPSHTNDSKVGNADFIQHGLIECFENQLKTKLHIIHRLDQTTTGAIVFGKSIEAAKKYQAYFRNRETSKTYLFVTAGRSAHSELVEEQPILHKGDHLEAKTLFRRLHQTESFGLWQAKPLTGRNHQIRIHSARLGIPVLGDSKYGGAPFPFLCLHNQRIEFPNNVVIKADSPAYFDDLQLLDNPLLVKVLFEIDRRRRLFSEHFAGAESFRLMHRQRGDEAMGTLSIDQFGEVLALTWDKQKLAPSEERTFNHLSRLLRKPILVRLKSPEKHGAQKDLGQVYFNGESNEDVSGVPPTAWVANEGQVKHELRADSGQSLGLFLDQRLQRNWVLEHSTDRSVLNLFSYTCGHSVAAAKGGAREVVSVDTSKSALNWGRKNFELNDLDVERAKFYCRDTMAYLNQCANKEIKFDLIICDPPAFSRGEKGVFRIEANLDRLLLDCLKCLNDGGDFLFSTNYEGFLIDDLRKAIVRAQTANGIKDLEINLLLSSLDFELPGSRTSLKSFLIRRHRRDL